MAAGLLEADRFRGRERFQFPGPVLATVQELGRGHPREHQGKSSLLFCSEFPRKIRHFERLTVLKFRRDGHLGGVQEEEEGGEQGDWEWEYYYEEDDEDYDEELRGEKSKMAR